MILKDGSEIRNIDQYRHKYDSAIAEYIDATSSTAPADDCTGDIDTFGLFVWRFGKRTLTEDGCGFVSCERHATEDEAEQALEIIRQEYNDSEPTEEDYVINPDGSVGIYGVGKCFEPFKDEESAERFIVDRMKSDGFRPNVWQLSDHGNYTLISLDVDSEA